MAIIELKDGRTIEVKGNPTPDQISKLLQSINKTPGPDSQPSTPTPTPSPTSASMPFPGMAEKGTAVKNAVLGFLGAPVELAEKTGSTIGQAAGQAVNKFVPPALKTSGMQQGAQAFEKGLTAPDAITPGGGAAFKSPQEAETSVAKAASTLSTPIWAMEGGPVVGTLVHGLLGAVSGQAAAREKGLTGTATAVPTAVGAGEGILFGALSDVVPFLKGVKNAESDLNAIFEAIPGKPIEGKDIAKSLDGLIAQAKDVPSAKATYNRLLKIQQDLAAKGAMSAPEAQAAKRSIYALRKQAYDAGTADIIKVADKKVANAYKTALEELDPMVKQINKKYGTYFTVQKFADLLSGGKLQLTDLALLAGGMGQTELWKQSIGLALKALLSKPAQFAADVIPSEASALAGKAMTDKAAALTTPNQAGQ